MQYFRYLTVSLLLILGTFSLSQAQNIRPVSGVVAMTTGAVSVSYIDDNGQEIGRDAVLGDPIYLNDVISTGPNTNLQILLKDQTLFTIGPDAAIVFDEFVYDPQGNEEPALTATVKKGVFKFISGKVSSKNPEAMTLKLPNATASIRGTTVAGRVRENGESDIVLLSGAIAVTSDASPEPVDIFQSGWGTSISAIGGIEEPFVMPADVLSSILSEASVSAFSEDLAEALANESEGEGEEDAGPATPEEIVQDFAEFAATELAANGETEVSFDDAISLLLGNDDLRAMLEEQGIDTANAPDLNYAYLDVRLLSMLASGGGPVYMHLQDDGGGNYSISHVGSDAEFTALISGSYAGSVRFASSDLALAPRGNATSAGGTFSYDYSVSYDTATAAGSYSISNLSMDGVAYGSGSEDFNTLLYNATQAGYEGDEDMVVSVGDEIFEVEVSTMNITNGSDTAAVQMNISFGSITDGNTVIDGLLGGSNVMINDVNDGEIRARAEKYEVGRLE